MSDKKDLITSSTPIKKKLRFRGDFDVSSAEDVIPDIVDGPRTPIYRSKSVSAGTNTVAGPAGLAPDDQPARTKCKTSFMDFFKIELTRGYILEHDEERYSARRQKIYAFMKIPRELEKFMIYGVAQCVDSFLYIHTFLPIRYLLAIWGIISRPLATCFGFRRRGQRLLAPAEVCDLLKGTIWIICILMMLSVDTNRLYHIIKSQSIIKLYIFYNMLEVGDRLLSAFGQDSIDALFLTATESKEKRREHLGLLPHFAFTLIYVMLHSCVIMFQATTINVAVNSNNKGLLTIMMSNNFVELKGAVFKKFDKNNLFQLTCSDVRERFHLSILLFVVVIQTMKEFNWSSDHFLVILPDCFYVLATEVMVDSIKHAFITRFNELPVDVYKEYTVSLAYDMTQTRQKHAFSDHSDLVARRMGFIPFPLAVVVIKAIYSSVSFDNPASLFLLAMAFATLISCRMFVTIWALGNACHLMKQHQDEKQVIANAYTNNYTPFLHATSTQQRPRPSALTTDKATSPQHHWPHGENSAGTGFNSVSVLNSSLLNDTVALGATALFSNSDVDLDNVVLNENVVSNCGIVVDEACDSDLVSRSVPDLQETSKQKKSPNEESVDVYVKTHKRSDSEPSIQLSLHDNISER